MKKGISMQFTVGFWSGVAVISLLNIALFSISHDLYFYDWYIFGVSLAILIVSTLIKIAKKKTQKIE